MRFLAMLFIQALTLIYLIGACRILSMTFKTFSRSITIKNHKLAALLIAYRNTWNIATSAEKRNKMSLLGVFSYIVVAGLYYAIAVSIKIKEADNFEKGKIW